MSVLLAGGPLTLALWDVIRDHVTLPPSEVAAVPVGFEEWYARATACKLDERFGSIKQAIVDLCAMQGNRPTPTAVDVQKVQGLAQILGDPPAVRVTPIAVPPNPSRPSEPQAAANTPPSVGLQSTVDPSSVTSSRRLKGTSWKKLAIGALAAGGVAAVIGYVARTSLGDVPSEPTVSLRVLSATPSASVAREVATGPSATPTASAQTEVVPVASGNVQTAPLGEPSGAPPTMPAPARPATTAVRPAPAPRPMAPPRATSTPATPAPPARSRAQKPLSQNKPAFDPNF